MPIASPNLNNSLPKYRLKQRLFIIALVRDLTSENPVNKTDGSGCIVYCKIRSRCSGQRLTNRTE